MVEEGAGTERESELFILFNLHLYIISELVTDTLQPNNTYGNPRDPPPRLGEPGISFDKRM